MAPNPTTMGSAYTNRFQGNVLPLPGNGTMPTTTYYSTIPASGIPTVSSLQTPGYPQLNQSLPFSIDYTLTGPLPTLSGWVGTNANTTDGNTSGVNMAPIQAMALPTMKGTTANTPSITSVSVPVGAVAEAYGFTLTVTGGTPPYTWSVASGTLSVCPTLTNGVCLSSGTGTISGTPVSATTQNFTAKVTDAAALTDTQPLSFVVNPALSIATTSVPSGTVGTAYATTLVGAGGLTPYTWSVAAGSMTVCPALTAGLCLNSGNGSLTGTPTTSGTSSFTVGISDTGGASATQPLSLMITPTLVVTTSSLPNGTQGVGYSQTLTASGGTAPYTWTVTAGSLCTGLSLTGAVISGTPTVLQTCSFTVQVTDSLSVHATAPLSISIQPLVLPLTITSTTFPTGTFLVPYLQGLTATGGTPPYVWDISAGALPAGLRITGAFLSGIPVQVGTFNFTLRVTDSVGAQSTAPSSLVTQSTGSPGAISGTVLTN
jgi:hypothetical protein